VDQALERPPEQVVRLVPRDAAALLGITESQLYRWVDDGDIPHAMVHHVPVFHRIELLEWALENELAVSADLYEGMAGAPLAEALERGGGHSIDELERLADLLRIDTRDRELARGVLRARRAVMFSSRPDGIAIPRARSTFIAHRAPPSVTLAWCARRKIALDREPVQAIFVIVAPTIHEHLRLLARLARAVSEAPFRAAALEAGAIAPVAAACRSIEAELAR
jgi:hypothetical protein